ncbi:hypothetical protein N4264_14085 [Tahibacter amnicola]|uniref:Histidinol phosphatase-like enzyme (Inositol monophosphatase family) n=1 Tax=Tahibacter amnicola TaxID=2976241 RepID=A0ABY6BLM2_9GAMM|nr:inositol monophosphatase family protein [Tahibacter amnicola]UXI70682.1 hypothetical protein N4264_14085 [Tahibacter amnicola]
MKADGTEVTEADRAAETVIRDLLAQHYPRHAILGEEFGGSATDDPDLWVIDPIDGTTWFSLGMPVFGTLIAYLKEQEPVVGVIHFPALGETVYAAKGLGCWFQPRTGAPVRVRVSDAVRLRDAAISASGIHRSDFLREEPGRPYHLSGVQRQARKFRFCGDCLQHALVCRGNLHAAIDTVMQPWDIAALVPCVEEAGGVATSLSGQRHGILFGGSLLTSCDRSLHDELLGTL